MVGTHPTPNPPCPPETDLLAFSAGRLVAAEREAVGAHLAVCLRCAAALDRLERRPSAGVAGSRRDTASNPGPGKTDRDRDPERASRLAAADLPHPVGAGAPRRLGRYQLHEPIGRGGMGRVYRARHDRLKKWVAVKILPPERTADPRAIARFHREMEAVGQLDHPNIVRATDAGEHDGVHFLVMELVEGADLGRLLKDRGPLPVPEACELARQAALGLQGAHAAGLVHRDVKPSNLLLSTRGEVKLLDLGLALLRNAGAGELTASGDVMGTADFMAPEQWDACRDVDIRADLYSLGCTLYALLTGHPPFGSSEFGSALRKMAAHAQQPPPPVRTVRPDVPAGLAAILNRLLAKNPADRYPTPADAARALEPFCGGADLTTVSLVRTPAGGDESGLPTAGWVQDQTPSSGPAPQADPAGAPTVTALAARPVRRRVPALAALALVLAGAAALAYALRDTSPPPDTTTAPTAGPPAAPEPTPKLPAEGADRPRVLKPGAWNELLDQRPTVFHWRNLPEAQWEHKPAARTLWVTTGHVGYLSLGRVESPGYRLVVGFRQERQWTGGFGVFVGGQVGADGVRRCQVVQLLPVPGARPFSLQRGPATVKPRSGSLPFTSFGTVAAANIEMPGQREQRLELVVTPLGLTAARWDGIDRPELVGEANRTFTPADYQGEFGIVCDHCSVVIPYAQIMPTE
jgi:serine/threonine protein kinase